jgi:threonine/homoserine/homoserine lactone efflux protein
MLGIHDFPLYVLSCILLNITPGQDTMYIVGRSVAQGKRAGILSMLGIMTGVLVHTLLAALGLSVILATSLLAFAIVKTVGAVYLIWIGIGFLLHQNGAATHSNTAVMAPSPWKIYRQGVFTNVLNPKVALFFLSFLPQFVFTRTEIVFTPFLVLGLVFFTTGSIWCICLVYGSSWLSMSILRRTSAGGVLRKLSGLLFIGLGVRLAFARAQ